MDTIMRWLAPKTRWGFAARFVILIVVVFLANIAFGRLFDDHAPHDPSYYLAHAVLVDGPLIAFFLAVSAYQLRLQRKLSRLSRTDGLTGLNNRRTFFALLNDLHPKGANGILLLIDADRFKTINDTYGHMAGDDCLRAIAYMLCRNVRKSDIIGRIGGEEFAIFLTNTSLSQARVIGERLTKPIPFTAGPDQPHATVTLSIGAVETTQTPSFDALFGLADNALYLAKQKGRARIEFWTDGMQRAQQPSLGCSIPAQM